MPREGKEQVSPFWMDEELYDQMEERRKMQDKSRTEYLIDLVKQDLNNTYASEIEREIDLLRERAKKHEKEAEKKISKAKTLQSKLDSLQTKEEDYQDEIEELAEDAIDNPDILDPKSQRLNRIGNIVGKTPHDVLDDVCNELAIDSMEDLKTHDGDVTATTDDNAFATPPKATQTQEGGD